jgi:predicted secreted protein
MLRGLLIFAAATIVIVTAQTTTQPNQYETFVGSSFQIQKSGTPTTGYQWTAAASNTAVLNITSKFEASNTIGAPGVYTFTFTGVCVGNSSAVLKYKRSFEPEPLVIENIVVYVKPKVTTKAPTTKAPTTKAPTTKAPTTKAPTGTTCPPIPTSCPCGVILPQGSTCKRCKINCRINLASRVENI